MLKNKFLLGSILATFVLGTHISAANALELDEDTRTVTLDSKGNSIMNNSFNAAHKPGRAPLRLAIGIIVSSMGNRPKTNCCSNLFLIFETV